MELDAAYRTLNVSPGTPLSAVKAAYRRLVQQWHPDRYRIQSPEYRTATARLTEINIAYQTIQASQSQPEPDKTPDSASPDADRASVQYTATPTTAATFHAQGIAASQAGEYEQAIRWFTQAIHTDDRYLAAYQARGFLCEKLGYTHRAQSDFQHVTRLKLDPSRRSPQPTPADQAKTTVADPTSGWRHRVLGRQPGAIRAIAWHPQGTSCISGDQTGCLGVWQLRQPVYRQLFRAPAAITAVAISPDQQWIAYGLETGQIGLCRYAPRSPEQRLGQRPDQHTRAITAIAWTADSQRLLSTSLDGMIRIWDRATGDVVKVIKGNTGEIFSAALNPARTQLMYGGRDRHLRIRYIATGDLRRSHLNPTADILSLAWAATGAQTAIAAGGRRTIQLWINATQPPLCLDGHADRVVTLDFHPTQAYLISGSSDGTLRVWDANTGQLHRILTQTTVPMTTAKWSPNGRWLVSGDHSGRMQVWLAKAPQAQS